MRFVGTLGGRPVLALLVLFAASVEEETARGAALYDDARFEEALSVFPGQLARPNVAQTLSGSWGDCRMWAAARARKLSSQPATQEHTMSTETQKKTVRNFFAAQDEGEHDAVRALLAPGFVAHLAGNEPMDAAAFEGMERMFAASFSNGRHIIESQLAEGDWVATRLVWTALHTGDFNGIPASHKPVRMAAIAHDRIVDGKIVEHRAIVDVMTLMVQIGAIPAAA
jgi:predicted ester cyclase